MYIIILVRNTLHKPALIESAQVTVPEDTGEAHRNAIFSLLLPGKVLHLNALLLMRKFRDRGNKAGAVRGFETLEKHGLGHLISTRLQRGANMVHISKGLHD